MKRILCSLPFLLFFIFCCKNEINTFNTIKDQDKREVKIVEYKIENNKTFYLKFSDPVELREVVFNSEKVQKNEIGNEFYITFPYELERGEKVILSITVINALGRLERASFSLIGKNENPAILLMNEISIKGTSSAPDRIELIVLKSGNTSGVVLSDGINQNAKYTYTFPSIDVNKYDIIVLYWDKSITERIEEGEVGKVYYLNAKSPSTLTGTSGLLVLKEEENGKTMDAFFYSDDSENDEHEGWGSEKLKEEASILRKEEEWQDRPMDSSLVTSSRVFARLPGLVDTNTSSDWFITKARASTFGEFNTYNPYTE